jgi:hypothetical protein
MEQSTAGTIIALQVTVVKWLIIFVDSQLTEHVSACKQEAVGREVGRYVLQV